MDRESSNSRRELEKADERARHLADSGDQRGAYFMLAEAVRKFLAETR